MKLELSRQIFEKILQISNFMKIRSVGTQLFHADGQIFQNIAHEINAINSLKWKVPCCTGRYSSYRDVNFLLLGYNNQLVNV